MLKGGVSEVMLAIFAILVGVLILALIIPRVTGPVVQYYGSEQAVTIANLMSASISGIASVEEGEMVQDLKAPWVIYVYEEAGKSYIVASFFDERTQRGVTSRSGTGEDIIVAGSVKPMPVPVTSSKFIITKEPDRPVEVKKV